MTARHRHRARTLAFQACFMLDARAEWEPRLAREFLASVRPAPAEEVTSYALRLLTTALDDREDIDAWLDHVHPRWRLHRMRAEDRAMLRLGVAELRHHGDVPAKVAIDEWIEIAKVFGGEESPRFLNGILDRAAREAARGADG